MGVHSRWLVAIVVFVVAVPAGLANGGERTRRHDVTLTMMEIAPDGDFEISPTDRFRMVDANATLRLSFETPLAPEDLEASEEWLSLLETLDRLAAAERQYRALAERASLLLADDASPDSSFIADSQAAQNEAVKILMLMVEPETGIPILTREELSQLMSERRDDPYGALVYAINRRREALHWSAARYAAAVDSYRVVIRAFLLPRGGQRQALHIEGYDNLPQGDFRPIDPLGLLPSPQEAEQIHRSLEGAQSVASAIENITANADRFRAELKEILSDAAAEIEALQSDVTAALGTVPSDWAAALDPGILEDLATIHTPGDEAVILSRQLTQLMDDIDTLRRITADMQAVYGRIRMALDQGVPSLTKLFELVSDLRVLADDLAGVIPKIQQWPNRLEIVTETTPAVIAAAVDEALRTRLQAASQQVLDRLGQLEGSLPAGLRSIANAAGVFSAVIDGSSGFMRAMGDLGAVAPESIPRPLDDLMPAELDLRYAGVTVGDHVMISVRFNRVSDGVEPAPAATPVLYKAEIILAGWHRRYAADVIFSRPTGGPRSTRFRADAAVSMEWHHFDRDKPRSFWNRLDPGFGFHGAFLSQEVEQNIELGAGINASVLDGLLRAGYGYNLTVEAHNEYWFVGFGFLSTFDKFSQLLGRAAR